jgi:competence protein ComEC
MQLQKLELFKTKKEFLVFLGGCLFILFYSLLIEYNNYKILTRFDSALTDALVVKQYTKTKQTKSGKTKTYQVLKLESDTGFIFYTTRPKDFEDVKTKKLKLEIYAGDITFYEYITHFYAYSRVLSIDQDISLKKSLNEHISKVHTNQDVSSIYQALYTATPLNTELQEKFSYLGVSHLLAISGFHLGVLATVLFFIFKLPYKFLQQRLFPHRSYKLDSFIFISIILFIYLIFLDSPPSLMRAYAMLVIGFFLYDRGYKIISMQTLLLTVMILLAFFPRLFFSIGFWLSASGVFYIFLFLIHFKHLSKFWQFILVPFWVYITMFVFSVAIFENFSIYHPLSIIWTSLFTLFYPISIFLHMLGFGDLLDTLLKYLLDLSSTGAKVVLDLKYFLLHIMLSLISIYKKKFIYILLLESVAVFIYSIKMVA